MTLDQILTAVVYLLSTVVLFFLGKFVYDKTTPGFSLKEELVENDNFALALSFAGYLVGLVFALGGVLNGPSSGLENDLIDIAFFGILAIVLLNISSYLNDKLLLHKFNNVKEIVTDRNAGTGAIEAGNYIAMGLIISGAISGEGSLMTALAFWLLGQIALILAGFVYNLIIPYDLHDHVERDNVAVGVAFAGVLIALGNLIRIGIDGDFESWQVNLSEFAAFIGIGFLVLPLLRLVTDFILLPGRRLTDELVNQEKPNVGAGLLEASSYVLASMLIGWVV